MSEFPHWSPDAVRVEAEKFADHWRSKPGRGATKTDWLATWRNWCRSDIAQRSHPAGKAGQSATVRRGTDEYAALHKSAGWWREAGFPTIWDAMAAKCWDDNAHEFRDGKRVGVAA